MEEVKINTPAGEMPKFKALEQRSDFIKSRSEYKNGLIIIFEQSAEKTLVRSNYNWIQNSDGSLTPDYSSPNPNFRDEK